MSTPSSAPSPPATPLHLCAVCRKTFDVQEQQLQDFIAEACSQNDGGLAANGESRGPGEDKSTEGKQAESKEAGSQEEDKPPPKRLRCSPSPTTTTTTASHGHHHPCQECPRVQCVACLGLLEPPYLQHLASLVAQQVDQCRLVGVETYSLSIHVPLSLHIRRIGMEMSAKRCKQQSDTGTRTETGRVSESNYVKDSLKWELTKRLRDTPLSFPLKWELDSPLLISLALDHDSSLGDCIGLKKQHPKLFPRPKKRRRNRHHPTPTITTITSQPILRALEEVTEAGMVRERFFLGPVTAPCRHGIQLQHRSAFVAGRYNKFSRQLPQTPWLVDGVRKADTSVQELICPRIAEAFRASEVRFSSSGREDVDVLMLGNGRPFLLELVNPFDLSVSSADLERLEAEINGASSNLVAVRQLKRVGKSSSALLKEGEEEKKKTYSALVWTEGNVTEESLKVLRDTKDLVLRQRTPIRVLHRRTLAVREKVIYSMQPELVDAHHFKLGLVTQAGTYIKEFVHGDFGRTQPNVGTLLGCDADILSLDVLEVQLQWPPVE